MFSHGTPGSTAPCSHVICTILLAALCALLLAPGRLSASIPGNPADATPFEAVNYTVTVVDKALNQPLELVRVSLRRGELAIANTTTNTLGRALFRDVKPGRYVITLRLVGYIPTSDTVTIDSLHTGTTIGMEEVSRSGVTVTAARMPAATTVDLRNGNQVFEGETYHAPPAARMTQLVQQNVAGAVRAPTGEVHVRGQHGEFTYLVDGIPIPLGVFGGLNEVVDPKVIDYAAFYTGGFPAEYGGQMSSIVDVHTKVPTGKLHADFSAYAGSYLTSSSDSLGSRVGAFKALNSNGQSLSLSDHIGNLGFFLSGSRQESDRRIDQPVQELFHDHGFDYFLYGKANYVIGNNDYLTANLNYGVTHTEVPYDSAEGINQDLQHTSNGFQTLSYFHTDAADADHENNFFAGIYAREGGLRYDVSPDDEPKQYIGTDTTTGYAVAQDRNFTTIGLRTKYDARFSHEFGYAAGLNLASTTGTEAFDFINPVANGPRATSTFAGSDFGAFIQAQWHPAEWTRLDFGVRYDQHIAPDLPMERQVSPRIKWSIVPDESTTFYLYYGRLFIPTNIESLHNLASVVGDSAAPTIAQRENLFEASFVHAWEFGMTSRLAAFYKDQNPGLDDETLGSSTVRVNVNIDHVHVTGLELALTYSVPSTPLSAFLNAAIIHAYGTGPVSGGFLAADSGTTAFDLDHDQRLSAVVGVNYQPENWFASLSATYGSGLTNGNEAASYATGLFDFNQAGHTTPSWILNVSAGYTFDLGGGHTLEPSLFVTNLLDHAHLVKGAFFSGASFEEPRNVVLRLNVHI